MMIPIGYMLKRVEATPVGMEMPAVTAIHSVSGCISESFFDYIPLWRHNSWWFFDNPLILRSVVEDNALDWEDFTLFYYEVFDQEYVEADGKWHKINLDGPLNPASPIPADVTPPESKCLSGYDVVTFWAHTSPECSPLSCNYLAREVPVNQYCLFDDFECARRAVEDGKFANSEPGPFRIFAVYTVDPEGGAG